MKTEIAKKIVLGISGASGAIYAERMLQALATTSHQVDIIASKIGEEVFRQETHHHLQALVEQHVADGAQFKMWGRDDLYAPFSSGSTVYDFMVVVPCSVGFLGRVANGVSTDLMSRAADVFLKEGRPLVLAVRETPLSEIHLKNMLTLKRAGATILPCSPGFYLQPKDIPELVDGIVQRILDQMQLRLDVHRRWRTPTTRPPQRDGG